MHGLQNKRRVNIKLVIWLVTVVMVLGGGALAARYLQQRSRLSTALNAGREAWQRRDAESTVEHFGRYLAGHPDDLEVLQVYAEANLAVRPVEGPHLRKALRAYRHLHSLRPEDIDVRRELVELCLRIGEYAEAEQHARRWHDHDGGAQAARLLGTALYRQHELVEARAVLEAAVAEHPQDVRTLALLADVLVDAGDEPAARARLNDAVQHNPQSVEAVVSRAFYRRLLDHDEGALQDLERAESLSAADPLLQLKLADEWRQWGQPQRARAVLQRLGEVHAPRLQAHGIDDETYRLMHFVILVRILRTLGDGPACVTLADDVLREVETWERMTFLPFAVELYLAARVMDKAERAVAEYEALVHQRPAEHTQAARNRLGLMHAALALAREETLQAIDMLKDVLAVDSRNLEARRALWQAYDRTEQPQRKLSHLEAYVGLTPEDAEATLELARSYRGLAWAKVKHFATVAERSNAGIEATLLRLEAEVALAAESGLGERLQAAAAELDALRDSRPDAGQVYVLQARIAALLGRPQDAEAALRAALPGPSARPDIAVTLAGLLLRQGRAEPARSVLQDAAARFASSPVPRLAPARMALQDGQHAEALTLLQDLRRDLPRDVSCRVRLLELPEIQAERDQARALIDELRDIEGPHGLRWRLELARHHLRGEDWSQHSAEVESMLGVCTAGRPAWAVPRLQLARLHELGGHADHAEQIYRRLVASQPGYIAALKPLLGMLLRQGRYQEAEDLLQRLPAGLAGLQGIRIQIACETGDHETAVAALRELISVAPADAASRVLLARLLYQQDSQVRDQAMQLLDEAESLEPGRLDAVAARAWIHEVEGDLAAADALIDAEVERRGDFQAHALRAAQHARHGRLQPAEEDYRKLTAFEGSETRGAAQLGRFLHDQGREADAVQAWRDGLKHDPDDEALRRALTQALLFGADLADREAGEQLLQENLARNPNDPDGLYLKAEVVCRQGTPDARADACALLEHACRVEPRHVPASHLLARLTWEQGDIHRAMQRLLLARGASPRDLDLQLLHAEFEQRMKHADVARRLVDGVLQVDPQHPGAQRLALQMDMQAMAEHRDEDGLLRKVRALHDPEPRQRVVMAHLLASTGTSRLLKEARLQCRAALEAQPELVGAHVALGRIEYHLGAHGQAVKAYRQALQLDPRHAEALNDLAWLLAVERSEPVEALGLVSQALSYYPDTPELLHTRGVVYRRLGDLDAATADLQRCVQVGRGQPQIQAGALLELAQVHLRRGALQAAQRAVDRVRAMPGSGFTLGETDRALLQELEQELGAQP